MRRIDFRRALSERTKRFRWPIGATAVIAFAAAALVAVALPKNLKLGADRGYWKGPTSGFRLSQTAPLLRGGELARIQFTLGRKEPAWVVLSLSRRREQNPVRVSILRDGLPYSTVDLQPVPLTVRVPFRATHDSIDLRLRAESGQKRVPSAYFLHRIRLERRLDLARAIALASPLLLGLGTLGLLWRRCGAMLAMSWALFASAVVTGMLVVCWDPPSQWQLGPSTWMTLGVLGAAIATALILVTRELARKDRVEAVSGAPQADGLLGLAWPWILALFGTAMLARLAFVLLVDQPLLYSHVYTYFHNGLKIATSPTPIAYVLESDSWHTWHVHWTIAPLYYIFLGAVLRLSGLHLLPVVILQSLLDSITAVLVGALGRQAAPRHGAWAGIAYALYWPAVELVGWTMTEQLQTPALVLALTALALGPRGGRGRMWLSGFSAGVASLARSVSVGLLALLALWKLLSSGLRGGWKPACLLLLGGATAILPWTARNVFIVGEPVLIEDNAVFNLWTDNAFPEDGGELRRQERLIQRQPTPEQRREVALDFVMKGMRSHPERFAERVRVNFWHFLRPEGLQNLLGVERSLEPWRHVVTIVLDDLILMPTIVLFTVFLFAGRPSPVRGLILLWTAYYLLMVVVVFHNEIRYRSALMPFALAGAAGGLSALLDRTRWRRPLLWASLGLGLYLGGSSLRPYWSPARNAIATRGVIRSAGLALERGDIAEADRMAEAAAAGAPGSARPWLEYGRMLMVAGHPEEALEAYRRGSERASPANWSAWLARPRLLRELGRGEAAEEALQHLALLSWETDPWLVLEAAWRELPPPLTDEILVGYEDYGAVRGFYRPLGMDPGASPAFRRYARYVSSGPRSPQGWHRWTRHTAWLRLLPTSTASTHVVTLHMGSPFPSPIGTPQVRVSVNGAGATRFTLTREIRPYRVVAASPAQGVPLIVRIDTPTWSKWGEPAEQGVRVDRMTVGPGDRG